MVEVKRKKTESFESLLRRFSRRLQQSGNALEARKIRFFAVDPNKNKQRASALRRNQIRLKREYLERIGQLKDEPRKTGRR
ncbi:30S ribosomal protein S21 [Candidatus Uhrbacteria bacterium]|nr:30S ribosomal protein S21 [Candidatus Uhrbacteria bacterium]